MRANGNSEEAPKRDGYKGGGKVVDVVRVVTPGTLTEDATLSSIHLTMAKTSGFLFSKTNECFVALWIFLRDLFLLIAELFPH